MPKASHFTILFLKACTTSWDAQNRLCGVSDLPAADGAFEELVSVLQSSESYRSLSGSMDLVLCGPSDVSMSCARALVGSGEVKIKVVEELGELNLGLWEGVLRDNLEDRFPSVYSQWSEHPGTVAPPDGESLEMVQERVLEQLFKALLKLKSENQVVGLVLRPYAWGVVKCWLDQRPLSEVWDYLDTGVSLESFSLDRDTIQAHRSRKTKIA